MIFIVTKQLLCIFRSAMLAKQFEDEIDEIRSALRCAKGPRRLMHVRKVWYRRYEQRENPSIAIR
jgi:hypothetical protein